MFESRFKFIIVKYILIYFLILSCKIKIYYFRYIWDIIELRIKWVYVFNVVLVRFSFESLFLKVIKDIKINFILELEIF